MPKDYWDHPLTAAVEIADAASASLPYRPDEPEGLGSPLRILVTAEGSDPDAFREIAWVYSDPSYGRFVVLERAVNLEGTKAHIAELLAGTPGCTTATAKDGTVTEDCNFGERTALTLPDGWNAVVLAGDVTTFAKWVEPASVTDEKAFSEYRSEFPEVGLVVEVIGPAEEITPEEAASIASRI